MAGEWRHDLDPSTLAGHLHDALSDQFVVDDGWAADQAKGVASRLHAVRTGPRLEITVLWMAVPTAFVVPGGRVYVSRELQQGIGGDGPLAFVLAHEMAHYDLGHLALSDRVAGLLALVPGAQVAAMAARHSLLALGRPELELQADDEAMRLCSAAGWSWADADWALRVVARRALDHRAVTDVFGTDPDHPMFGVAEWWRQRKSGYVSVHDRRAALRAKWAPPD